jgi:putative transposase
LGDLLKYSITLTDQELKKLTNIVKFGKNSARKITRAWILLKSHEGLNYEDIIKELNVSKRLILKVRKRYCEEGLDSSLEEKPRPGQPKLVTSDIEAKVTALACETPPKGRNCWTLDLLKTELEDRFYVSIGRTSIQKVLKSHDLKPWKKKCGAFPSLTISTLIE